MSTNMNDIIKLLREPFPYDDMECKVQATTADKAKGLAVFYVNSRAIQNRLDEVVGPLNWCNEYRPWQGSSQICGISIYDSERSIWVEKFDGAENTDYEPIKGGLSDAFKRAAVVWGIGRYLYNIDGIWVDVEQKGKSTNIKDSEKQKIRDYYNKRVGKVQAANTNNSEINNTKVNTPKTSDPKTSSPKTTEPKTSGQSGNSGSKQNTAPEKSEYEYEVKSAKHSGNSTCLQLLGKEGSEITAYVKKDSPGIVPGALIKNVQMEKKQNNEWTYYMLNKYEVAA